MPTAGRSSSVLRHHETSSGVLLRTKHSGAQVWIADVTHRVALDDPVRAGTIILTGSWSGAGRFSVARPFQRPVVFVAGRAPEGELQLRVTDTTTQETGHHTYTFRPGG